MLQYLVFVFAVAVHAQQLADIFNQKGCNKMAIQKKCPNKNVTFWLYNDKTDGYHLDEFNIASIQKAPFNDGPIKILLHGYTGNKTFDPNPQIRPEYLRLKYNVISIDYGPVAQPPCYFQSVWNADTIASCFADFINLLLNVRIEKRISKQIALHNIHVIGFSMGGQIAGDVGHKLQKKYNVKLPRVTALDPALPLYYGKHSKITRSSAKFVDCLHTSAGIFGKLLRVGTADFYFNFIAFQNGCSPTNTSCNHLRGPEYFAESITTTDRKFCGSNGFTRVIVGEYCKPTSVIDCVNIINNSAAKIGRTRGVYYVRTNAKRPFAKDGLDDC